MKLIKVVKKADVLSPYGDELELVRKTLKGVMTSVRSEKEIEHEDAVKIQITLDSVIRLATWIKKDVSNRVK